MSATLPRNPGDHLVAQFEHSHEHFPAYQQAAAELIPDARSDAGAARALTRVAAQYGQHLHIHHTAEEVELFPAVLRARPDMQDAVDQLLAHHRSLAEMLERLPVAARAVAAAGDGDRSDAVDRLAAELDAINELVTDHLAYEESTVSPVVATWAAWPF